ANGAHYAAWIYPDNSVGGPNMLKLVKFQDWTTFSVLASTSLAPVGTNYHTVKLAFHGNNIAVYFDRVQRLTGLDVPALPGGGVSLDMWTDAAGYVVNADDIVVSPLVGADTYATLEDTPLTVPASGVLTNDTEVY